jgi:hypothetical protein
MISLWLTFAVNAITHFYSSLFDYVIMLLNAFDDIFGH